MCKSWGLMAVSVLTVAVSAQAQLRTYHIGNSLTNDTQPWWIEQWTASHDSGWHIRSNESLNYIWNHPADVTIPASPSEYSSALPGHVWDAIVLQPYGRPGGTLGTEVSAATSFVTLAQSNPANISVKIYILAALPASIDYNAVWNQAVPANDSTPVIRARAFYELMRERVAANTGADVFIVPEGEVFYALNQRIAAGEVPGVTSLEQFYKAQDTIHLNVAIGRYIAATTLYSTLYGVSPSGLPLPADAEIRPGTPELTPELFSVLNDTVWDVVSSYGYSGVDAPEPSALLSVAVVAPIMWRRRQFASGAIR